MERYREDKIISQFLHSIGPWRDYIVIGGGFALFIYKLYLADQQLNNIPIGTRDIDSIIPRRLPDISSKNIAKHLLDAGFMHIFKDYDIPATEAYVKEIDGLEVEIEFLTDSSTRNEKYKNIFIGGIVAQPLSYLTLSLQMTTDFETYSGESGRVVSPGAWIFHKGLTFTRRRSNSKMLKDLYGIWYVATQLGSYSDQALSEFSLLTQQHSKWFKSLKKNLLNWMEQATRAEWATLEDQDPAGKLNKAGFVNVIQKLWVLDMLDTLIL